MVRSKTGKKAPKAAVKKQGPKKTINVKKGAKKTAPRAADKKSKKALIKKTAVPKQKLTKAAIPQVRVKRPPGMSEQILKAALQVLDERQAEEVFTIDLAGKSSMADYLIIASGRASRQLSAIAHYLREAFEKLGLKNIRVEGLSDTNWVLVDAGDVIIHLFRPEVRSYYNLESIWRGTGASKA